MELCTTDLMENISTNLEHQQFYQEIDNPIMITNDSESDHEAIIDILEHEEPDKNNIKIGTFVLVGKVW